MSRTLLAPVALGLAKPPTPIRATCPLCGTRHRITSEVRKVYCGCRRGRTVLILDWARAG